MVDNPFPSPAFPNPDPIMPGSAPVVFNNVKETAPVIEPVKELAKEPVAMPRTVEEKNALLAKDETEKDVKRKRIEDIKLELEARREEYRVLVVKSNDARAKFAADEDAKLLTYKQEMDKLEGEMRVLVEETKFEPEYIRILKEYGGLESNIPLTSAYWKLRP